MLFKFVFILISVSKFHLVLSMEPKIIEGRKPDSTSVQFPIPNSTSRPNPNCSGSFWVGNVAKLLSIPEQNNETPVSCRWLLKARDRTQTIGLSTVNTTLNLEAEEAYFKLEARDGWSDDAPVISTLEWSEGIPLLDWPFLRPVKAKSGFLLLQYTSKGKSPLQMDFVYYTCGGRADSRAYISSPIFTEVPLRPTIIDCEWELRKPRDALYGYLKLIEVNITDCSVLQMRSNASMQVIEKVSTVSQNGNPPSSANLAKNSTNTSQLENFIEWGKKEMNFTYRDSPETYEKTKNRTVVPICGDSTKMVVFSCTEAKLLLQLTYQQADFSFKAYFSQFSVPDKWESNKKVYPWYFNYCVLTIFTPIGVVIGGIIILYQNRKRGPGKTQIISSDSYSPPSICRLAPRAASFHFERPFRTGGFRNTPGKRSRSLNDKHATSRRQSNYEKNNITQNERNEKIPFLELASTVQKTRKVSTSPSDPFSSKIHGKSGILRHHSTECISRKYKRDETEMLQDIAILSDVKHVRFQRVLSGTNCTQTL